MQIFEKRLTDIRPYEKNPRKNDGAVQYVANSIKEFGFKVPIVIDKDGVIVAGHTRYKAAKQLGLETVPCVIANDLSDEQVKAFRLADNKTGEFAEWDMSFLDEELENILDIDMKGFGFEEIEDTSSKDDKYTKEINIPQYEIQGDAVSLADCVDTEKAESLVREIYDSKLSDSEKEFLIKAAYRHYVFDYRNIAEYYAAASKEMQTLMEKSALVIIDYENAIANGYVKLSKAMEKMRGEDSAG